MRTEVAQRPRWAAVVWVVALLLTATTAAATNDNADVPVPGESGAAPQVVGAAVRAERNGTVRASVGGGGLPVRQGRWRLHVWEQPKRVRLEGTGGEVREFAVPVFVYVPEEGDDAAALAAVEERLVRALARAPAGEWRRELDEWLAERAEAERWRALRPVGGASGSGSNKGGSEQ